MNNFFFSIPTTAYFGKGQISVLGETIRQHGGSKVLLAYGGGSIKANGVYDATIEQLNKAGLAYVELSGIQPNPRIESVEEGIRLYHENGCDFILGVGAVPPWMPAKVLPQASNMTARFRICFVMRQAFLPFLLLPRWQQS
ncbi:MAG TPA: iron-containing alcohol dehydrogenase [Deltaproteobacteria bacterium]|nr:iron-containing alcohol dehydrogenase [Deltaproteobacteria bacterium]